MDFPITIKWQKPMMRVFYSLIPIVIMSVALFGLKALLIVLCCNIIGILTEFSFTKNSKQPVTSAVLVTSTLFALSLPPTIPLWMASIGIIFGVTFGKMVFGGFGKNIFNPALVGRAFLYISFPVHMTTSWIQPYKNIIGGFQHYLSDAITQATPMTELLNCQKLDFFNLLIGFKSGSLGETSAILIILGGIFITIKKAANYRIVVSCLISFLFFQSAVYFLTHAPALSPVDAVFTGSFLFGLFYFATEPVSASQNNVGRYIYGAMIGLLTVVIRTWSSWDEGMMFAILLANTFAPLLDYYLKEAKIK